MDCVTEKEGSQCKSVFKNYIRGGFSFLVSYLNAEEKEVEVKVQTRKNIFVHDSHQN